MKEELEKIIELVKLDTEQEYVDSSVIRRAKDRLEKLKDLYELLYGY